MVLSGLKKHVWRCYAKELVRPTPGRLGDAFDEAVYKATILAVIGVYGFALSLFALLAWHLPGMMSWMFEHEGVGLGIFIALGLLGYSLSRNYLLRHSRIEPDIAVEKFGQLRDRVLVQLQFWFILIITISAPFAIYALRRELS